MEHLLCMVDVGFYCIKLISFFRGTKKHCRISFWWLWYSIFFFPMQYWYNLTDKTDKILCLKLYSPILLVLSVMFDPWPCLCSLRDPVLTSVGWLTPNPVETVFVLFPTTSKLFIRESTIIHKRTSGQPHISDVNNSESYCSREVLTVKHSCVSQMEVFAPSNEFVQWRMNDTCTSIGFE